MECTQVWGYDDLVEFQATQQDLSSQIGRTPALSFCPTCGIYLLDTGSTQAQRDAHIQSCRDVEDPEGFEVVSEGEDSDDATEDSTSVSKSDKAEKRLKTKVCTEQDKACNQENTLAPTTAEVPARGSLQPQLAPQRPAGGILTEANSSASTVVSGRKHEGQVRDCTVSQGSCCRSLPTLPAQTRLPFTPQAHTLAIFQCHRGVERTLVYLAGWEPGRCNERLAAAARSSRVPGGVQQGRRRAGHAGAAGR